jgi:hypothetical protein
MGTSLSHPARGTSWDKGQAKNTWDAHFTGLRTLETCFWFVFKLRDKVQEYLLLLPPKYLRADVKQFLFTVAHTPDLVAAVVGDKERAVGGYQKANRAAPDLV